MKTTNQTWKQVSISGVTGILMGAGAIKAIQAMQSNTEDEAISEIAQASAESTYDNMSFREAFEAARAELGAGGVFRWHGNVYNTYTADEWNAKTEEEQDAFAEEVGAEISADEVDTSNLAQVQVDEVKVEAEEDSDTDVSVAMDENTNVVVSVTSEETVESEDDDVRVLGYGEVTLENGQNITVQELDINGQNVAVIDVDQDGEADYAMTDLNHNQQMDAGEVIDLHTGEAVSFTNDNNDDFAMAVDTVDL